MTEPAYVAVDWGTSSFRLWLVDRAGQVLTERRSGEGMLAAAKTGFPAVLQSHLAAIEAPDHLPVLVCGMAGARNGWVEAGYVDTPAPLAAILNRPCASPAKRATSASCPASRSARQKRRT
ncbi:2-keto-3-deoxy-galactonokinase [Bradyrhizobium sp. ERR14]|nr:2-keto-3-deoxy-galactonokinase [Bradyrhizobium sp. ERR14]